MSYVNTLPAGLALVPAPARAPRRPALRLTVPVPQPLEFARDVADRLAWRVFAWARRATAAS